MYLSFFACFFFVCSFLFSEYCVHLKRVEEKLEEPKKPISVLDLRPCLRGLKTPLISYRRMKSLSLVSAGGLISLLHWRRSCRLRASYYHEIQKVY